MFRAATPEDLLDLTELEQDASLRALGHVFPPDEFPFPFSDVLARWSLVLDDPTTVTLVCERPKGHGLAVLVTYDDASLRHLAVHPTQWGKGLGRAAVGLATEAMAARGCAEPSLWALVANDRARRLYAHLGWRETNDRRESPWPPHPVESRWMRVRSSAAHEPFMAAP